MRFIYGILLLWAGTLWAVEPTSLLVLKNGEHEYPISRAELDALPQIEFSTTTPWSDGLHTYRGPLLTSLLKNHGIQSQKMMLIALDEYSQPLDLEKFKGVDVILATSEDGRLLSRRSRGYVWVMLPLSRYPELDHTDTHALMVWQLTRIESQP
ncbi:hypothetical protein [Aeromonas enterica]|jgi:hypothetical protein